MQKPFRMIAIAMASFSDGFIHDTSMAKFASSVMSSGKYLMNPELTAQQVSDTHTHAPPLPKFYQNFKVTPFCREQG
jgi:hypothetical protein